ncbi:hypothetical protein ACFX13_038580 [Malus domestica]
MVWLGSDIYHTWLDVDLHKLSLQGKSSKETLEVFAETAKFISEDSRKKQVVRLRDIPSKWPVAELAANSMYRISQTLLLNCEGSVNQTEQVIRMKCSRRTIKEREETLRHAVHILGKTEHS